MTTQKKRFLILSGLLALAIVVGVIQTASRTVSEKRDDKRLTVLSNQLTQRDGVIQLNITSGIFYGQAGTILGGSPGGVASWVRKIDRAAKDDNVKGMLIRMNSPGGTIGASQELYEAIVRFKKADKKIVVSIIDLCASGGYYVAVPADTIMANPGSLIGSIGVRISANDYTELLEKIGVNISSIKSVPYKDFLSPFRPSTETERTHVQKLVDDMHKEFVETVVLWRGTHSDRETLNNAANGLFYTSQDAIELGLIDKIGDLEAAKKELAQLTGLDYENLHFINYKLPYNDFVDYFLQTIDVGDFARDILIDNLIENILTRISSDSNSLQLQ